MTVLIVMPVVAVMPASHIAAFFEHRSFSEGVSEGISEGASEKMFTRFCRSDIIVNPQS